MLKGGESVQKKLSFVVFFGIAIFLLFSVYACAKDSFLGVSILKESLEVAAEVQMYARAMVRNPLTFDIRGAVGSYDESHSAIFWLEVNTPVKVQFSASPLAFIGDSHYSLDVKYWINDESNSFSPQTPLILAKTYNGPQILEFMIHGRVTINEISAQPAGSYKGLITVTVSPAVGE